MYTRYTHSPVQTVTYIHVCTCTHHLFSCAHIHTQIHSFTYLHTFTCTHTRSHSCTQSTAHTHVHICTLTHLLKKHMQMQTHSHTQMQSFTYSDTHTHTLMCSTSGGISFVPEPFWSPAPEPSIRGPVGVNNMGQEQHNTTGSLSTLSPQCPPCRAACGGIPAAPSHGCVCSGCVSANKAGRQAGGHTWF